MANRYWVLGTGVWSTTATGNWSATSGGAGGASVPTAADSVFFDQAGTYSVTMTGALTCLDITVSAGTVTFATGTTPTLTVSGSMSLAAGTSWFSGLTTFNSSTTGRTITTNGVNLSGGGITFANVAGGWSLGSSLTFNAALTLTSGALDLNGFDITCYQFVSNNTNTRSVAFGSNTIFLVTPSNGTTVLSMANATNFTYTGTGGFSANATPTRTYNFGGTAGGTSTNAPNLTLTGSGTAIATFSSGSCFNHLDFGATAFTVASTTVNVNSLTLSSAAAAVYTNLTVSSFGTGTITTNGKGVFSLIVQSGAGTTTLVGNTLVSGASGALLLSTGTLDNPGTITCGNVQIVAGASGTFTMGSTAGTITASNYIQIQSGTLNYNDGTLTAQSFLHTSGTLSLGKNLTASDTLGQYAFTTGTIQLNGYNLTFAEFVAAGTSTNARNINFGTGNIILNHSTAGRTVLSLPNVTNSTFTGTGGFVSDAAVTRTYTFGTTGGSTTKAVNLSITSGSAVPTITSSTFYKTLNFTGSSCTPAAATLYLDTLILSSGGTFTGLIPYFTRPQTLSAQFGKVLGGFGVLMSSASDTLLLDGTQTFTTDSVGAMDQGILDLGGYDLSVGTFQGGSTNQHTIAFGSNDIILTTTTAGGNGLYLRNTSALTITGTGQFVTNADVTKTHYASTSGAPAANVANLPKLRFTGSGTAAQTFITGGTFNSIDFGTTAFTVPATAISFGGNLILSASGTFTGLTPTFISACTFTTNNKPIAALTINCPSATTTLNGAVTFGTTTATTTLTAGTLDLNGNNLTTGIFSSSNTNTRSVTFGANYISLAHTTAAQTVLSMTTATNFTWTGTGGFSTAMSVTRTVDFAGTSNAGGLALTAGPNLFVTSGASTLSISGSYKNLDCTGSTCSVSGQVYIDTLTLATGGTYTGFTPVFTRTQTWTAQFSKQLNGIGVSIPGGTLTLDGTQTYIATSTVVVYAGTLDLGGFDLTVGICFIGTTNTRSIAFGANNIILAHTTAGTTVLNAATATGFTWTGTGGFRADASITRTFTFGTTGGTATNAPNLTLTGSGTAIQTFTSGSWFNNLNFGTTAFVLPSTGLNLSSFTLSSGGTFTGLTPTMVGTGTITTNGKTIPTLIINCPSGTTTLNGPVTYASALATTTLTAGTLDLNGNNLTTGIFSSSGTGVRSIAFGANNIILAHTTAATTVLAMATLTNFSWTGTGGFTAAADITRTYTAGTTGGTTTNAPNLTLTGSGTANPTFTTNSWFNTLSFGTTNVNVSSTINVNSVIFGAAGLFTNLNLTMVGTGTITNPSGKTISNLNINCPGGTTTLINGPTGVASETILTAGTLVLNGYNLTTATFSSSNTNTRSITFGSNFIFTTTGTAATTNIAIQNASGFSCTGAGGFSAAMSVTRTFTVGTTSAPTVAPNLFLTSGASVPTLSTGGYFNTLNFTGSTCTPTTTSLNLINLVLASGGTYTGLSATMRGTGTITPAGKTINTLVINHAGTTTLSAALACAAYTQTAGTLDFATFNLTCSGFANYTAGTLSNIGTLQCATFTANGAFTLTNGNLTCTTSFVSVGGFTYAATAGTFTTAAFTQTSGDVTFSKAPATMTGAYTLTAGTLTLDGVNLTVGTFSSSNSNVRTIDFGPNYIVTATITAAATNVSMSTITNATFIGDGGFSANMSTTRTFTVNTSTPLIPSLSPNLFLTGGTSSATITSGCTFNMFSATGGAFTVTTSVTSGDLFCRSIVAGPSVNFGNLIAVQIREAGGTISSLNTTLTTNTGLWKLEIYHLYGSPGVTSLASDSYIGWRSATASSLIMRLGTLDLNGFNLSAVYVLSNENSGVLRSITYGSNFIYARTPATIAQAFDVSNPQGFTHSGTGGVSIDLTGQGAFSRSIRNGLVGAAEQATSINECPNIFITGTTATSDAFNINGSFNTVDLGTNTCAPVSDDFGAVNFTASPNGTYTDVNLTSNFASGTFDLKGKTFIDLSVEVPAGQTTTFGSNATFSASTGIDIVSGNIDLNGYTLSVQSFASTGTGTRQILGAGAINCSLSWTVTTGAGFGGSGAYSINMTRATAKTFEGGGGSYGTLVQAGAGALTISGANTFADIQATTRPSTITFTAGTTQTFDNFTLSGTAGNLVTINSTTAGSQYTLYKASGTVDVNYLSIRDSNVTGGAYWGTTTSTFVSNNTGWNPTKSTGNFMAFF